MCVHACSVTSVMSNSATIWIVAHQALLSMGFPRQEHRSGLPYILLGIFLTQGSNPSLLQCRQILYHWANKKGCSLSHVQLFVTPWTAAHQASLSFTMSQSLLKLMSIESVMPSNHLNLCRPLLLLPPIHPSIRVFSQHPGSVLHIRWPKYCSFISAKVIPMSSQGWFPLGLTGCISLLSKGLSRVFSSTTVWKDQFFGTQLSLWSQNMLS